jgi:3-oxoacyl-[acyl-carrier protein] reductase
VNAINAGAMATGMYTGLLKEMLDKVWSLNYMASLAATREGIDSPDTIAAAKGMGTNRRIWTRLLGLLDCCVCMRRVGSRGRLWEAMEAG